MRRKTDLEGDLIQTNVPEAGEEEGSQAPAIVEVDLPKALLYKFLLKNAGIGSKESADLEALRGLPPAAKRAYNTVQPGSRAEPWPHQGIKRPPQVPPDPGAIITQIRRMRLMVLCAVGVVLVPIPLVLVDLMRPESVIFGR
jgi:hypothetical protein